MSFKSIGELCRDVIAEAELAARGQNGGHKLKSGGRSAGRRSDQPPTLYADAPAPSGSRVKGRGAKPRQVQSQERDEPTIWLERPSVPALVLVVCNDGRGLPHAARNRDFARPGSRPSLRIVGGHASMPSG
jgi:hypothetical protein